MKDNMRINESIYSFSAIFADLGVIGVRGTIELNEKNLRSLFREDLRFMPKNINISECAWSVETCESKGGFPSEGKWVEYIVWEDELDLWIDRYFKGGYKLHAIIVHKPCFCKDFEEEKK